MAEASRTRRSSEPSRAMRTFEDPDARCVIDGELVIVLRDGWLTKQGHRFWKAWRIRWFILTPEFLFYTVNRSGIRSRGKIDLNAITSVAPIPLRGRQGMVIYTLPGRKDFFVIGEQLPQWMAAIRSACRALASGSSVSFVNPMSVRAARATGTQASKADAESLASARQSLEPASADALRRAALATDHPTDESAHTSDDGMEFDSKSLSISAGRGRDGSPAISGTTPSGKALARLLAADKPMLVGLALRDLEIAVLEDLSSSPIDLMAFRRELEEVAAVIRPRLADEWLPRHTAQLKRVMDTITHKQQARRPVISPSARPMRRRSAIPLHWTPQGTGAEAPPPPGPDTALARHTRPQTGSPLLHAAMLGSMRAADLGMTRSPSTAPTAGGGKPGVGSGGQRAYGSLNAASAARGEASGAESLWEAKSIHPLDLAVAGRSDSALSSAGGGGGGGVGSRRRGSNPVPRRVGEGLLRGGQTQTGAGAQQPFNRPSSSSRALVTRSGAVEPPVLPEGNGAWRSRYGAPSAVSSPGAGIADSSSRVAEGSNGKDWTSVQPALAGAGGSHVPFQPSGPRHQHGSAGTPQALGSTDNSSVDTARFGSLVQSHPQARDPFAAAAAVAAVAGVTAVAPSTGAGLPSKLTPMAPPSLPPGPDAADKPLKSAMRLSSALSGSESRPGIATTTTPFALQEQDSTESASTPFRPPPIRTPKSVGDQLRIVGAKSSGDILHSHTGVGAVRSASSFTRSGTEGRAGGGDDGGIAHQARSTGPLPPRAIRTPGQASVAASTPGSRPSLAPLSTPSRPSLTIRSQADSRAGSQGRGGSVTSMTSILDEGALDMGDATGRVTTASSTSTHAASHFHDVFILGEVLGKGAFSTVHKTWHKRSGTEFAVKVLRREAMNDDDVASLVSEVQTQRFIRHPNIVRLVAFFDNDDDNFYLVTELCKGGELFDRIVKEERFSEKQAAGHVFVLLDAMHSFHKRHIVHRDIKPENILYSDTRRDALLKIADFGFAVHGGKGESLRSLAGSPNYLAPEIVMNRPYGVQVDMWSFGVVTYIMLCGYMPFDHPNQRELFELIKAGRFDFPARDWSSISADAKDFISKLLVVDPRARLTAEAAMRHPWITKTNLNDAHLVRSVNKLRSFHSKRRASMVRNAFRATSALMLGSGAGRGGGGVPVSGAGGVGRRASLAGPLSGSARSAAIDMAIASSGHGGTDASRNGENPSRTPRRSGMGYRVSPATARTIASTIDEAPPSPVVRMAVNEDPADADSRFNGVLDSPKVFADESDGSMEGGEDAQESQARQSGYPRKMEPTLTGAVTGAGGGGRWPVRNFGTVPPGPGSSTFVPRRRATSAPEEAELSLVDEAPSTASLLAGSGDTTDSAAAAQVAANMASPLAAWTPGGSRRVVAPRFSSALAPIPPMGSPPGTPKRA